MKTILKKKTTIIAVAFLLLLGGLAIAGSAKFPHEGNGQVMQVFAPNQIIDVSNGSLTVSGYSALMFAADVTIQINGSGSTQTYPADTVYGVAPDVTTLTISGLGSATTAMVM